MTRQRATLFRLGADFWRYTAQIRPAFYWLHGSNVASKLAALVSPYILGNIINILQQNGKAGVPAALHWVIGFAAIQFVVSWLDALVNLIQMRFTHKLGQVYRRDIYHKIRSLPLLWQQDHHSGNLLSRMNEALSGMQGFSFSLMRLIGLSIGFIGPIFILMGVAPFIGAITLIMSAGIFYVSGYFDTRIKSATKICQDLNHAINGALSDYVQNIRTIIVLKLGLQTERDIARRLHDTNLPYRRETSWRASRWMVMDVFVETVIISCIALTIYRFQSPGSTLLVGSLVMVITYLRSISGAMYDLSFLYKSLTESISQYEGSFLIADAYGALDKTDLAEIEAADWQRMEIADLQFTYAADKPAALSDVSFTLRRGEKIALVGASGGGKSTLMSVLRGLYETQSGTLSIDGAAFATIEPLAALSTLIPQDPEIFENTIRYNVTLGVEHSDAEILEACRIACFDSVLATLPKGLDSRINEKGVNLSGGQRQRLALARGIFAIQDSSLVLFDEPTSSVDSMTERQMYRNLFAAFPDICLISSIHRLNLLGQFDTIWVMESGRLVQQGTLADLLAQTDLPFARLWAAYQHEDATDAGGA